MSTAADSTLLGRDEAITFWDDRHRRLDSEFSGGDVGLSDSGNAVFYARRLGRLLETIGHLSNDLAPIRLLDAGCGPGVLSRALSECGFAVTGVDSSPAAIESARVRAAGPEYVVSPIDDFWADDLFDVVIAIDVMFHITDDRSFESSLHTLAHHVAIGGLLIVTDRDRGEREPLGDYIVHRPAREYDEVLEPLGLSRDAFVPYAFPGNPIGFHRYIRARP